MQLSNVLFGFRSLPIVLLTTAMLVGTAAWARTASEEPFDLVSRGLTLPANFYNADHPAVTPDGRYVVFRSSETGLVSPSTIGYQIFLRDRVTGTTELISQNDQGAYGNGSSDWPAISDDGCRVVFESNSTNLGDLQSVNHVFLRIRCPTPATTQLVALSSAGDPANGESSKPDISGDGTTVVFAAYANNLVPGVTERDQIYRRDLATGITTLLSGSVVKPGQGGNFGSACPAISNDGSRTVFWSYASDLVSADNNGLWDMFLYDAAATGPKIRLVSSNTAGLQQNQGGEGISSITCPAISGDGQIVAFASRSTNLVNNDNNGFSDIFVKDTITGTMERASVDVNGQGGNADSIGRPSLSLDGTYVVFNSSATNLTPNMDTGSGARVVMYNRQTQSTSGFVPTSTAPTSDTPAISDDLYGRFVASFWGGHLDTRYPNTAGVFLHDRNQAPIANAGPDQSLSAIGLVTLDGSQSYDPDDFAAGALNDPLKGFTWTQTNGPSVSFSNVHAKQPTFTPPADGTYTFNLVVFDGMEYSAPDSVTINVSTTPNSPPTANAGQPPQNVIVGDTVQLAGSGTDPEGHSLTYKWTQTAGPNAVTFVPNGTVANPSFNATAAGTYTFQLVVNDGFQDSLPSTVTITVAANQPPTADAGLDQNVIVDGLVHLAGSGADPEGHSLTYKWTQTSGPVAITFVPSGIVENPSFTATGDGAYTFQLIVNDGYQDSAPSMVTITAAPSTLIPNPGNDVTSLNVGNALRLDGRASLDTLTNNNRRLKYQWQVISMPTNSDGITPAQFRLSGANSARPVFKPPLPGDYVFGLTVSKGKRSNLITSPMATVSVHVDGEIKEVSLQPSDTWILDNSPATVSWSASGMSTNKRLFVAFCTDGTCQSGGYIKKGVKAGSGSLTFKLKATRTTRNWQTTDGYVLVCQPAIGRNDPVCGAAGPITVTTAPLP